MAESQPLQSESTNSTSVGPNTKLFVGGLSWNTDEEKLRAYFAKFGAVEDVVVMRDRATRNPRGFGFVTFASEESAVAACKETHCIDGRTIDAKPSVPQGEGGRPRSKKVFVGGLAPDTTEDQFREYFSKFGTVLEATIMVDHTSMRSRGFGFVTFEEESSVQEIFKSGSMHSLGGKQVEVKSATPKGSGPLISGPRGAVPARNGFGVPGRGNGPMGNGVMGRGYDSYGGQQGYGMPPYGVGMPGQYPQYPYGMPPYGGFPGGMMVGYSAYGGYPTYGQYGQQQQQQQHLQQQQQQQQQQPHSQQDNRRVAGPYAGQRKQHPTLPQQPFQQGGQPPLMQMQALSLQGHSQ